MLEQRGVCREIVEVLSLVLVFSRSVFGADQTGAMMFTEEGRGLRRPSGLFPVL